MSFEKAQNLFSKQIPVKLETKNLAFQCLTYNHAVVQRTLLDDGN